MVINTESVINYNNKLKQATLWMHLGINKNANTDTKKVGIKYMEGGLSKINRPTSWNPLNHKEIQPEKAEKSAKREPEEGRSHDAFHDKNKTWLILGLYLAAFALSVAWTRAQ